MLWHRLHFPLCHALFPFKARSFLDVRVLRRLGGIAFSEMVQ